MFDAGVKGTENVNKYYILNIKYYCYWISLHYQI